MMYGMCVRRIVILVAVLIALDLNLPTDGRYAFADPAGQVQIFDVEKGKVVKSFPMSEAVRSEVRQWLDSVSGPAGEVKADPAKGVVIRVPLDPPLEVNTKWYRGKTLEVYLFPGEKPGDKPRLLLFGNSGLPLMLRFDHDIRPFLRLFAVWEELKRNPLST